MPFKLYPLFMTADPERLISIVSYLSGQMGREERHDFEQWINASAENKRIFSETRTLWESSGARLTLPEDETDALWLKLQTGLYEDEATRNLRAPRGLFLKIAASILLVAVTIYIYPSILRSPSGTAIDNTAASNVDDVAISAGNEVVAFYLPDSSKVWLNAGSKLMYARNFGKGNRQVHLEGEAYFDVKRGKPHVFTLTTAGTRVRVVGTVFNVKQTGEKVVLTVAEGKVKFSDADTAQAIMVVAGENASLTGSGTPARARNRDDSFEAWRRRNNPEYEREKAQPASYLRSSHNWHKNLINRSVIQGQLTNVAALAAYTNIVLKVTYAKRNGRKSVVLVKIHDTVKPGGTIRYEKRLLDILNNTRSLEVEIASAALVTSRH
jgi:transmembrane sensor